MGRCEQTSQSLATLPRVSLVAHTHARTHAAGFALGVQASSRGHRVTGGQSGGRGLSRSLPALRGKGGSAVLDAGRFNCDGDGSEIFEKGELTETCAAKPYYS